MLRGTHKWDARVALKVPFADNLSGEESPAAGAEFLWHEYIATGLLGTYSYSPDDRFHASIRCEQALCAIHVPEH